MDYVRQILCLTTVGLSLVYGRQQYFRVQPRDVQVREGGVAMLECEVANLAGQVQWAKEGFALGFSSVIPGLPRHSMVVDRPHGIYNLRVSNASLEDDAEYECQVGPAKPHKAIRAKARLNVMSPPSSVEILNYRHFSKIEIKENEEFHLECRVRNAKPAAKIVWYRGIVELNIPNRDDQIIEVPGNNGDKRFTRYDTHSRISLKATAQDDHAEYTCEAMHEALSSDIPMKTSVQFSVFYPPGLSYIEGYTKVPPSNSSPSLDEENLKNFSDFLITVGTVVGTLIILMNVLLISCFLHRISKKRISEQSNQTRTWATIEMCAPNSHNDTVTGETLSSVNDKSATYSNEGSKNDYVEDDPKQATRIYFMVEPDYPGVQPVCLSYDHDRTRARDDQSLDFQGTMTAKSTFISAPPPAPPADGSYYNMSHCYLSNPPPLDFQDPPPIPALPQVDHMHNPMTPPLPANESLLRHQRDAVPSPDVLHKTSENPQSLLAQILEQEGYLV